MTLQNAFEDLAVESKQDTGNASLSSIDSKITTVDTSAVVVAGSALPTGAAIAANQQTDALTDAELRATPVPVSGTVTATPTGTQNVDVTANTIGLATAANQLPDGHNVTVDNGTGASAVPIQDGGNSITVDGTVGISGTVPVSGTFWQATQPVSAASLPTHPVTQSGTWNVGTVTNITNQGQIVDNAAFADGTTRLNMAGYIYDEVAGTALTENDGAAARIDSKRAQVFAIEDATTRGRRTEVTAANALKVDGSAVTQPVSGTITANLSATDNTVLDNIDANTAPTTGLNTGRKVVTTAGTAVAIASSTTCKWVAITAETDNTDLIVVGDSGVIASLSTREGIPLYPADSIVIPIDNLADVYIDSLVSGEGCTFLYGT